MLLARYKISLVNLVYKSEDEKENIFKQPAENSAKKNKVFLDIACQRIYFEYLFEYPLNTLCVKW